MTTTSGPTPPLPLPLPGSCDTHVHFYDQRWAVAANAVLRPPDASVSDYRAVQAALQLDRVVVVQPTTYGLDNRCQLQAVAEINARPIGHGASGGGPQSTGGARAVVVIDADATTPERLRALTMAGARGARFHMLPGGAVGWDQLAAVAAAIAPFGWHIQLQLNGHDLRAHRHQLRSLPCDLVIDHVGRFMPPAPPDSPAFRVLLDLVDTGAYVKLSAPYESAKDDTHAYQRVGAAIDALVGRAPDRLLWATNWPHPGQPNPPDVEHLARLRDRWLPTDSLKQQVLVDNPARLYDF